MFNHLFFTFVFIILISYYIIYPLKKKNLFKFNSVIHSLLNWSWTIQNSDSGLDYSQFFISVSTLTLSGFIIYKVWNYFNPINTFEIDPFSEALAGKYLFFNKLSATGLFSNYQINMIWNQQKMPGYASDEKTLNIAKYVYEKLKLIQSSECPILEYHRLYETNTVFNTFINKNPDMGSFFWLIAENPNLYVDAHNICCMAKSWV